MSQFRNHIVKYIIAAVVLVIAVGFVARLNNITKTQLVNRTGQTFETGVVVEILQDNLQADGTRVGQQTVVVEMTSGEKKGESLVTTSSAGFLFGAPCTVGMDVIVLQSVAGDTVITSIYSEDRGMTVIGFAAAYVLILCLVGGMKGVRGALGLIFTFAAIMYIYLPLVYLGYSPFWVAVLVCGVTALVSMFFIGGLTQKTLCATLGTLAGVVCAGVAASTFSNLTGITGWNVSDIESLMTLQQVNGIFLSRRSRGKDQQHGQGQQGAENTPDAKIFFHRFHLFIKRGAAARQSVRSGPLPDSFCAKRGAPANNQPLSAPEVMPST